MRRQQWLQRAREFVRAIETAAESVGDGTALDALAGALPKVSSPQPAVGQLWRVTHPKGLGMPALVILTHTSAVLRGVLAIEHTWMAGHDDVVIQAEDSPTCRPILACPWSDTPIPSVALAGFVGEIGRPVTEALLMILQRRLTGGFRLRAREVAKNSDVGAVRWEVWPVEKRSETRSFCAGPRITDDDDPRHKFREVMLRHTGWLAEIAVDQVFDRGGAPEQLPWTTRVLERLREALGRLGLSMGGGEQEPIPAIGVPAVAGWLAYTFPPLGAAMANAVRAARGDAPNDRLWFSANVGEVKALVSFEVAPGRLSVTVKAMKGESAHKGLAVFLKATDPEGAVSVRDTTDETGTAWLVLEGENSDSPIEIVLGRGDSKSVIRF